MGGSFPELRELDDDGSTGQSISIQGALTFPKGTHIVDATEAKILVILAVWWFGDADDTRYKCRE